MKNLMRFLAVGTLTLLLLPGCSPKSNTDGGVNGAPSQGKGGSDAGLIGNNSKDSEIQKAVTDKLSADADLKTAGIKAQVTNAQVFLEGEVKGPEVRQKAEDLVLDVIKPYSSVNAGVVNNLLVTEKPTGAKDTGSAAATNSAPTAGK